MKIKHIFSENIFYKNLMMKKKYIPKFSMNEFIIDIKPNEKSQY